MSMEKFVNVLKCYKNGGSVVVRIPKEVCTTVKINAGDRWIMKIDESNRLILEKLEFQEMATKPSTVTGAIPQRQQVTNSVIQEAL
jgi:antitoxin component of MazEF toxin-antitoxin module